jgi:hypothetical protein
LTNYQKIDRKSLLVPPVEAVEGLRTKALDGAALLAGQKASLF